MTEPTPSPDPQAAMEQAAILRAILNTAVDAIITIDERGTMRHVNAATERLFGYSRDELVGRNVSMLMPSPDRERHDQYIRNYLATGAAKIIGIGREVQALRKDGSLIPVDLAVSESSIAGQRLFTGIIRDMSERNRFVNALRAERHFSEDLFRTANAIILILDLDGRIIRFNPFMEQLCGYSLEEVQGRDWFETFLPPADRHAIRSLFQEVVQGRAIQAHVNPIVIRSGEQRIITWSGRRLHTDETERSGVLAIGHDITDLKEAERRLIQAERLAAIGQMVTGLAHESRNALQRARACLDVLELDAADHAGELKLIRRAQQALDELQRLYDEVRNYAAPLKPDLAPCHLLQLCRETWDAICEADSKPAVELRLPEDPPETLCHCDRSRMQQVLRNILENAIYVTPPGGAITVGVELVEPAGEPPRVRLRIRDQGPGMSPEQRARIFEPFYTTKTKGTGLGMAIARRIVEAHGGEIAVGDPPGGNGESTGAEIVLTLPVVPDLSPDEPESPGPPASERPPENSN